MKVFALISNGYSDAVGFNDGKLLHWSKTDFAKDEQVINELHAAGKAVKVSHEASPQFIRNLGELLIEAGVPFQTFQIELTLEEIELLNNRKMKQVV